MSEDLIKAEPRTEFGKGAARRLRREGKIPAVLYEHGHEPIHVTLPRHATSIAIRDGGANAVLEFQLDSGPQLALTKDIQADPIRGNIEHLDFIMVKKGEKVIVEVPIEVLGEAAPETMVMTEATVITVEAEATNIPETISVSVEGAEVGTLFHAGDLELPTGVVLISEEDTLLVNVTHVASEEELEAALGTDEDGDDADVPTVAEADEAQAAAEEE